MLHTNPSHLLLVVAHLSPEGERVSSLIYVSSLGGGTSVLLESLPQSVCSQNLEQQQL